MLYEVITSCSYIISYYKIANKIIVNLKDLKELNNELKVKNQTINDFLLFARVDAKFIITNLSSAFCKLSGYTIHDLIGKSLYSIRHLSLGNKIVVQINNKMKKEESWYGEIEILAKDGHSFWLDIQMKPEYKDNYFIGYLRNNFV